MPTYVYQAAGASARCGTCTDGFETFQKMSDATLTTCPQCGSAIQRIIQPTNINTKIVGGKISDAAIKSAGFTKLTKDSDGKLRKQFGNDPATDGFPSH